MLPLTSVLDIQGLEMAPDRKDYISKKQTVSPQRPVIGVLLQPPSVSFRNGSLRFILVFIFQGRTTQADLAFAFIHEFPFSPRELVVSRTSDSLLALAPLLGLSSLPRRQW